MTNYVLTANGLTKQYKHFKALDNFSMHIPKGAIYGFVGKNGAGKTTLIRIICGLQKPTSGEYTLYGKEYTDKTISKVRRRMGAVVETPSIYQNMTAKENLKEQFDILGLPSYEGIDELLVLTGLSNTGNKKAKNFSLGMRQRLGIAIALAGDPDFLVLDEPANGLHSTRYYRNERTYFKTESGTSDYCAYFQPYIRRTLPSRHSLRLHRQRANAKRNQRRRFRTYMSKMYPN